MRINNIINCHKPKNFTGLKETGKVRYKHYEQMSDSALSTYSMAKAYYEVKDSTKSRLLKAMPAITSTLIATSLAITQPGKLSTKVSTGVGFLALVNGIDYLSNKISKLAYKGFAKKQNGNSIREKLSNQVKSSVIGTLGATAVVAAGAIAVAKGKTPHIDTSNKTVEFLKSEADKLVQEINQTKLSEKVEKHLNPFMAKHEKAFTKASFIAPLGLILGQSVVSNKLRNSISEDLADKAVKNYIKGKAAQHDAKLHFDSIDAVEI